MEVGAIIETSHSQPFAMASDTDVKDLVRETRKSLAESSANFDINAMMRGAQLTVVGALRALQNPEIFKYEHYRQAALALCAGIALRLVIAAPVRSYSLFGFLLLLLELTARPDIHAEGLGMAAILLHGRTIYFMGRQIDRRPRIHCQPRPSASLLPHESYELHHSYSRSCV